MLLQPNRRDREIPGNPKQTFEFWFIFLKPLQIPITGAAGTAVRTNG